MRVKSRTMKQWNDAADVTNREIATDWGGAVHASHMNRASERAPVRSNLLEQLWTSILSRSSGNRLGAG
jgi:hypothetical protein